MNEFKEGGCLPEVWIDAVLKGEVAKALMQNHEHLQELKQLIQGSKIK